MECNYQFRQELARVHKPDRRDPEKKATPLQVEIDSSWTIVLPEGFDGVLKLAAQDLQDYFFTSMGVCLPLAVGTETPEKAIVYSVDGALPEHSYRFSVGEGRVELCGRDSRFAAQAGYFAEDLMNLEEAPFLDIGECVRTSLFHPRMVHSGYGLDMYPDEHIRAIAHAGISALLVFVKGVDLTPFGYQDFNDLCCRAARYGVDVYAYSYIPSHYHPEDEQALAYYESTYGALFDRCPYFKGVIFVGESCEFPSKDPRTTGLRRLDNKGPDGKPLVVGKPNPGFFPCFDYPAWLNLLKGIIRKRRADADIVFWSYNWGREKEEYCMELIDALPTDITLMATYEMFQNVERDGIVNRTTDYTLFFEGPGDYFISEAKRAHERGLRFYAMTNTAGLTWDLGVVPYVPAPYQWIKRYEGMLKYHRENGLCGTMDSHHYGFYPSFISELAKWAFYAPKVDLDEILHKIAARDFTKECAREVCRAYECFSEGIRNQISTSPDQYGPCRIGPAFPLILFEKVKLEIPSPAYAHFGGNKIVFPGYFYPALKTQELMDKFEYEIRCYEKVAACFDEGTQILERGLEGIPQRKRRNAQKLINLARFFANTARTVVNVKEWKKRKERLLSLHGEERNRVVEEMLEIAKRELENARNTIPLVEFDSRLGYEPSMEYMCDRAHLEWKMALTEELIAEELPGYAEGTDAVCR